MVKKVIHQIVGRNSNFLIERCLRSWDVLKNEGFEVKIWTDQSIQRFIEKIFPFAYEALINARNYAEAADIARYLIVYHYGGYYMDWDIELLDAHRFLTICKEVKKGFLIIDSFNGTLASECFSAQQGEPFLYALSQEIIQIYRSGNRKYYKTPQYSGPYRMREALKKHQNPKQKLIEVNDIFLYNYREIRQMPLKERKAPLIHYWVHGWLS